MSPVATEAGPSLEAIRAAEFGRFDEIGLAYLDYTGAAPYPATLVAKHARLLERGIYGNPHSSSAPSRAATQAIEETRRSVLAFFDADSDAYTVIFTANASAAIKLVAEAFPFASGSIFVQTVDNHNSVNGVREFAKARGARVLRLPIDAELRMLPAARESIPAPPAGRSHLLAYPAQSNFSGVQHPLDLVPAAQRRGYRVLLDAAAFVPSNRLSLREVPADFVPVSFYKMFGYPTGVGALIARRDALSVLRRPWFAGGTVEYVSVAHDRHSLAGGAEAFEDGTPNFLAISAVLDGLAFLSSVGMERIRAHVRGLIERLLAGLGELHHPDGSPLVLIHGPRETSGRGGTVALNVLDAEGHVIPFDVVEREAGEARIAVRGGCFCNPGAAEAAFGLADQASLDCLNRFEPGQFSPQRFAQCLDDRAVGAVRVSVGIGSTQGDVDRFITFLSRYRGRIFGSTKGGIP